MKGGYKHPVTSFAQSPPFSDEALWHNRKLTLKPSTDSGSTISNWGTPGKQSLILLHGGSAYAQWWDFFAPAFSENFHVIAPDWRGHGESQHVDPPAYSSRHYIDDLHKLLVKIGIERPVILGHSMGGHNAVIYATEHAAEMAALVMVDTNVSYPESAVQFLSELGEKPAKVFDSFAEAVSRFRVLPRESVFLKRAPALYRLVCPSKSEQMVNGRPSSIAARSFGTQLMGVSYCQKLPAQP